MKQTEETNPVITILSVLAAITLAAWGVIAGMLFKQKDPF